MGKNVFIAGKELSAIADFAEGMVLGENNVAVAVSEESEGNVSSGIKVVKWNRGSGVGARSAVIQSETAVGFADNYILYYDSPYFASVFNGFSTENCAEACDILVSSFQFLALEIINRIKQRKEKSRLVFVLKAQPNFKDVILSPNIKAMVENPSNPFVAAGEAAFATFAENISIMAGDDDNLSVLLVSGDLQNEVMQKDSVFASWLNGYLNASDELKSKPSIKAIVNWVKAGSKNPGGFSLFR